MKALIVSIERSGVMFPVGSICGNDSSDAVFQYSDEYLQSAASTSLSISLPLQTDPFSPAQTARYFEGLLPEGFTRRSVAQWMHVDEGDYIAILHGLGRECLGAICITEEGESYAASYEPISDQQVRELAAEGASKSVELVTKSHLSLTGASGKVGLYFDSKERDWFLPQGTAPAASNATAILASPHARHALTRWCPCLSESVRPPVRQSITTIGRASS